MTNIQLPPDPEGMNNRRAAWAGQAIHQFVLATGTDLEDALSDLLADLMHWSDRRQVPFDRELARGRDHYEAETLGEKDARAEALPAIAEATREGNMTALAYSPAPWSYEYSPYSSRRGEDGIESELPAFEIFDADCNKVFDTNEDTPCDLQEANARLASTAPRLLAALIVCANLLADYDKAEGQEGDAYREAISAISEATGKVSPDARKPIVIEVRGGVVQDVLNVPPGIEYEIRDYDNQEETT